MVLPTSRELQLEASLRQKDKQISELTDEVAQLRQYVSTQAGPSTIDTVAIPPNYTSLLLPYIASDPAAHPTSGSSTVTAALTQRARLLQEENDELYELLRASETGQLKEEVRGLRRVAARLEAALRESHQVIGSLSTELNKSYETIMSATRQTQNSNHTKLRTQSPRNSYHHSSANGGHSSSKPPPTGPRAHKKPRTSDNQASPPSRGHVPLPSQKTYSHSSNASRMSEAREYSRHSDGRQRAGHAKMEVDDEQRVRSSSQDYDRGRDFDREREYGTRERGRERGRDRDREGSKPRRNGHFTNRGGGQGGGRRERNPGSSQYSADRTLAERLGPLNNLKT